jgi:uncharacterized membrane protein
MIFALLLACASDAPDTGDPCADAPVVGWNDIGRPLLLEYCATCHSASAPDRFGAPAGVDFDDEAAVTTHRDRMIAVLSTNPPSMPPLLQMPEEDRALLLSWLRCDVGR